MKTITDLDDPRLVKALAHPVRVRVMGILEQRSATPKQLAEALGVNLENVAYHVRKLRDLGLIKLERRTRVGGAVEHHYRAVALPRVSAKAWSQMPEISQRAMIGAALDQIGDLIHAAAIDDGFARPDSHVSRRPLVVDDEGFAAASKVVSAALDELSAIERDARKRIRGGAPEIATTAVALLFETSDGRPEPAPAAPRRTRSATGTA